MFNIAKLPKFVENTEKSKGEYWMKKLYLMILTLSMLLGVATLSQAADKVERGNVMLLGGNESALEINCRLFGNLSFTTDFEDYTSDILHVGLKYRLGSWLTVKTGAAYDFALEPEKREVIPYGGIDFAIPFGESSLKVVGYYDTNYMGKDWARYQAALQIQMYPEQYLYAGVMGDYGAGAPNIDNQQARLYIGGDFGWRWDKVGLKLQPILFVTGELLHDYSLTYSINKQTDLVLNLNTLYNKDFHYRAGVNFKF